MGLQGEACIIANLSAVSIFIAGILINLYRKLDSGSAILAETWISVRASLVAYAFLFRGADMIDDAYLKAKGRPFEIFTPGTRQQMVTSRRHLAELNMARPDVLSLHAVAKDFLQPKHTMMGFEWKDIRGVEGTGFVRAIRSRLTSRIPQLIPLLNEDIAREIHACFSKYTHGEETSKTPVYDLSKIVVARVNCRVFFGEVLCENQKFVEAAGAFPYDTAISAEILRLLPRCISRLVSNQYSHNYRSSKVFHKFLTREVQRRFELQEALEQGKREGKTYSETEDSQANDGLQWVIDTSPKKHNWAVDRLVGEVMGIWYGSVHTLTVGLTYAIMDLYSHTEVIGALREEWQKTAMHKLKGSPNELPLMDSFLKESSRLSAFECTAVRRKALQPFSFSDGLHIKKGDWVCVPSRSMLRDPSQYSDALQFDPFRFYKPMVANQESDKRSSQKYLTDVSEDWIVWGLGRIACPGRFYAVMIMKMVLVRLLMAYDCELIGPSQPRSHQWRSSLIPKRNVRLMMKGRPFDH